MRSFQKFQHFCTQKYFQILNNSYYFRFEQCNWISCRKFCKLEMKMASLDSPIQSPQKNERCSWIYDDSKSADRNQISIALLYPRPINICPKTPVVIKGNLFTINYLTCDKIQIDHKVHVKPKQLSVHTVCHTFMENS